MTYLIETYHPYESGRFDAAEFETLDEAREEVAGRLGVALTDDRRGGCPNEESEYLVGVECWMPYIDQDHIPDGTVFVYRRN